MIVERQQAQLNFRFSARQSRSLGAGERWTGPEDKKLFIGRGKHGELPEELVATVSASLFFCGEDTLRSIQGCSLTNIYYDDVFVHRW